MACALQVLHIALKLNRLYSSHESLQQLRQLLTPPEQIPKYLITLIPAALPLPPQGHPKHTLTLSQAAAAAASTCGLQKACSGQVLLLLQVLLGPDVSLSLQEWLQFEGEPLLADRALRGDGAAAAVDGAVGVGGKVASGQQGFKDHGIGSALTEEGMKPAVVEVLGAEEGMDGSVGLSGQREPGAGGAVRDRAHKDMQSNMQRKEVVHEEYALLISLGEAEPVGHHAFEQQQQQQQQQSQVLADHTLQRRQVQGPLHSLQLSCERLTSDDPQKKRQRKEAQYVDGDQYQQPQQGLQQQLQVEQLSTCPCATATILDVVATRPIAAKQGKPLQQQLQQQVTHSRSIWTVLVLLFLSTMHNLLAHLQYSRAYIAQQDLPVPCM